MAIRVFFFSSRRRHTRYWRDWSSDVCSSDLTGRLTSEMVIKTVLMRIPVLVSRSGFTAWGVELARQAGLTLIGRARGKRFVALSGLERIVCDADAEAQEDERPEHRRKGADPDRDAAE